MVERIDPATGKILPPVPIGQSNSLVALAVGQGRLWVATCDGEIIQIAP